uniref:Heat shock factor binding protein n=1 Tax=Daucus carota subsp. sativus TaxID=79200 RepID=A0A162AB35_DAUCS
MYEDGSDADDTKQSTADMTVFVSSVYIVPHIYAFDICLVKYIWLVGGAKSSPADEALDEMGTRIDELEQSINDLKAEMGQEGTPSPSAAKAKEEPKTADDSA